METKEINLAERIPEIDRDFLAICGYSFTLAADGNNIHVILHEFPFPEQYSQQQVDLRIVLPAGYPNAAVDMFRTWPILTLVNSALPVGGGGVEDFDGKRWQVWSRHIKWRAGRDDLRSFMRAITKEIAKGI